MKINLNDDNYGDYFEPELKELDDESVKIDSLYDEAHQALEKNINRMNDKTMFGSSSPYRDISELSKTLGGIRQTKVSIVHEKIALKKTISELELKSKQTSTDAKNGNTNELLMRDILAEIGHKVDINKPTVKEMTNDNGKEMLDNLSPKSLGINENDLKMIDKFKKGS